MMDLATILGAARTALTAIQAAISLGKDVVPIVTAAVEVLSKNPDDVTDEDLAKIQALSDALSDEIQAAPDGDEAAESPGTA